jgi:acyl carrier protein
MSDKMTQVRITDFILDRLSAQTHQPKEANYGVDSIHALSLCAELEEWLNIEIEPTIAWDYPTIAQMAEFLESEVTAASR